MLACPIDITGEWCYLYRSRDSTDKTSDSKGTTVKNILIIDISDRVAGEIARMLKEKRCSVQRLVSQVELSRLIAFSSDTGWIGKNPPHIILIYSQLTPQILQTAQFAEMCGIRVVNSYASTVLCADRVLLLQKLKSARTKIPDFYWGHPTHIPTDLGEEIVVKSREGHAVLQAKRHSIQAREELVYCERLVPNHSGVVRTVYLIGEAIFTVAKEDSFFRNVHGKRTVNNYMSEVSIPKRMREVTKLDFFNVDLIDGVTIDVNSLPNIFPYTKAIESLVEHIDSL